MDSATNALILDVARRAAAHVRVRAGERDDAFQEAALAAIEALPRFDSSRGHELAGYLYTAARNRLNNVIVHEQRLGRHRSDGEIDVDAPECGDTGAEPLAQIISVDEALARTEQLRSLRSALQTLPSEDVTLLRAIYVDRSPHHHIATEAACSRQAVTKRHHRALERTRAAMFAPTLGF